MAYETVLIVDDNADARLLLSVRLKAHGYEPVFAADGLEAIAMARQAQPDVILLDLGLPGGSGFLVLDRLKCDLALAGIPVVIVSAEEPEVAQARALAGGAAAFVQKPVAQRQLVETIERVLATARGLAGAKPEAHR